jgi:nicotinamidase-related amidase
MKKYLFFITISIFLIINSFNTFGMGQSQQKSKTALLIIDIQNFYFPNGSLPLFEPEKAALNTQKILKKFRNNNLTIIHVKHNASSGDEIHEFVKPIEGEKVISKDKTNSFVNTDLLKYLKENNITDLIICGMQTHMCLEAATRAASDYGFNCTVIEDACTTRDLKFGDNIVRAKDVHSSTLSTLNKTYAEILTTQEYLIKPTK